MRLNIETLPDPVLNFFRSSEARVNDFWGIYIIKMNKEWKT